MKYKKVVGLVFLLGSMSLSAAKHKKNSHLIKFHTTTERSCFKSEYYKTSQKPNTITENLTSLCTYPRQSTSRIVTRKKRKNKKDLFRVMGGEDKIKFLLFQDSMGNYITKSGNAGRSSNRSNKRRYEKYKRIFEIKDNKTK